MISNSQRDAIIRSHLEKMKKRKKHYYRYVGITYKSTITSRFIPAAGYIFKCLTEEQVINRHIFYGEVWEKVKEK